MAKWGLVSRSGGSKGGARDAPPSGSEFFHFHALYRKILTKVIGWRPHLRGWCPLLCLGYPESDTVMCPLDPPTNQNFFRKLKGKVKVSFRLLWEILNLIGTNPSSDGPRISQSRGHQLPRWGANLLLGQNFSKNCMKMK